MDEELFASVMTLHPMPPDPVKKEHKVLPGSMARYCNLKKMFSHPWDESSVWQAERVGDGLPVALKHIVCDLWRGEQELSMHLSANGAPGKVNDFLFFVVSGVTYFCSSHRSSYRFYLSMYLI